MGLNSFPRGCKHGTSPPGTLSTALPISQARRRGMLAVSDRARHASLSYRAEMTLGSLSDSHRRACSRGIISFAVILCASMFAGGCSAGSTPPSQLTSTNSPSTSISSNYPYCRAAQMRLRFQGSEGLLGTTVVNLRIQNTSQRPCSLLGYPRVRIFNAAPKTFLSSLATENSARMSRRQLLM